MQPLAAPGPQALRGGVLFHRTLWTLCGASGCQPLRPIRGQGSELLSWNQLWPRGMRIPAPLLPQGACVVSPPGLSEDFLWGHPHSASSGVTQEGVIVRGFPSFAVLLTFSFTLAAARRYVLEKASLLYPCLILVSRELGLIIFF